jgi:hypothetical protein
VSDHNESVSQGSIWPAALALGLSLLAFGVVTSGAFTAVGIVIALAGTAGWISALRHE